jgi:drug/metabolite transporter (DMT)-like permease
MGDFDGFHWSQVSAQSWWSLAYLIGPGAIITMSAYIWLLSNAPISLVSTYAFVNPVVAVFLGAVISNEKITAGTLVGGAIIVTSVAIVVWSQAQDAKRKGLPVLEEEPIAPAEAAQPA